MAEKFIDIDGLGVERVVLSVLSVILVSLDEGLPDCSLSATGRTNDEHAVTNVEDISAVDTLLHELLLRDETHIDLRGLLAELHELGRLLVLSLSVGEQIADEPNEDRLVVSDDLGNVEISQGSHEQWILIHLLIIRVSL